MLVLLLFVVLFVAMCTHCTKRQFPAFRGRPGNRGLTQTRKTQDTKGRQRPNLELVLEFQDARKLILIVPRCTGAQNDALSANLSLRRYRYNEERFKPQRRSVPCDTRPCSGMRSESRKGSRNSKTKTNKKNRTLR